MFIDVIILVIGFFVLIKGADLFVDGASSIAGNFKIPKILIGLTIVAFGTSAPELAVSIKSLTSDSAGIVIGNVIGSNILNILLILGSCALFHNLNVKSTTVKKELPITLLFTTLFSVLMCDSLFDKGAINDFTRLDGIVLMLFFSVFIYYLISMARKKNDEEDIKMMSMPKSILYFLIGIICIVLGSNFVVESAIDIAKTLGVSERIIGLTIIALGTSLPELVTSISATRKGEYDIAIGNVVGSNIFNIGIVIGLPVSILGGIGPVNFGYFDLGVMLLSALLLFLFSLKNYKINFWEGLIFLVIFTFYYTYILIN